MLAIPANYLQAGTQVLGRQIVLHKRPLSVLLGNSMYWRPQRGQVKQVNDLTLQQR